MTETERIAKLEKKVRTLEHINYVRFAWMALGLLGVTAYVWTKIKK